MPRLRSFSTAARWWSPGDSAGWDLVPRLADEGVGDAEQRRGRRAPPLRRPPRGRRDQVSGPRTSALARHRHRPCTQRV